MLRLNTTLSLLVVPMSFAARLGERELEEHGFEVLAVYDVEFRRSGQACQPTGPDLLRVLRNAVAHLPDFAANEGEVNVAFDEGILRLWNRNREEVVFRSEAGFVAFLGDLTRLIRSAAGKILKSQATRRCQTNKCS